MGEDARAREYPATPRVGVAGVAVDGDEVLLIRRGRAPMAGAWSVPGGALELGETMVEGVAREVWEETRLRVRPVELLTAIDRIVSDETGLVQFHYVVVDWLCELSEGAREPVCGDDAMDARWVRRGALTEYGLSEVTLDVIEKAFERAEARGR